MATPVPSTGCLPHTDTQAAAGPEHQTMLHLWCKTSAKLCQGRLLGFPRHLAHTENFLLNPHPAHCPPDKPPHLLLHKITEARGGATTYLSSYLEPQETSPPSHLSQRTRCLPSCLRPAHLGPRPHPLPSPPGLASPSPLLDLSLPPTCFPALAPTTLDTVHPPPVTGEHVTVKPLDAPQSRLTWALGTA